MRFARIGCYSCQIEWKFDQERLANLSSILHHRTRQGAGDTEPPSFASTNDDQAAAGAEVTNMFAALTLEEPTLGTDAAAPTATKKKAKKQPSQEYKIQGSSAGEFLLAVLGFLRDYTEIEKLFMIRGCITEMVA